MKNEIKVTRITEQNKEYFRYLFPEEVLNDDDLLLLGAVSDEGVACSALAAGIDDGMAYIEWLYTDPEMRERGAASALLDMLLTLLYDTGLDGIEAFYPYGEWEMDDLLTGFGFLVGDENNMYKVPTGDLVYSEQMDEIMESFSEKDAVPLAGSKIKDELRAFLAQQEIEPYITDELSDIYSFVSRDDDGRIRGCILVSEENEWDLKIEYLISDGLVHTIEALIGALTKVVLDSELTEGHIYFTDGTDKAISLVEKITGEDRDTYRVTGYRHAVSVGI